MDEKRQFSRILFATQAQLQQGGVSWETQILDLSLNGALVEEPLNFTNTGEDILLHFTLPGSDIVIDIDTVLSHQEKGLLGLTCHFIDIESISHLKRMVELNLGDASLLDRELALFIEAHDIENQQK